MIVGGDNAKERTMNRSRRKLWVGLVIAASFILVAARAVFAHPGSSIVVDDAGRVYFVDTGQGVWRLEAEGRLTLVHTVAYHWMALDQKGHFAESALGDFDGGTFERVTSARAIPALVISSDYPAAVGQDGALYYVPYEEAGPRQIIRRTPAGPRSVFATLPPDTSTKPMRWVNGIATGPDGALYVTDNDAIWKVDRKGAVTSFRDAIQVAACSDPLPDTPKLPYLRGLAVHADGTIYAAANGCRSIVQIPAKGPIRTVLAAEAPWSPTGVAVSGGHIYVLEYLHIPADDRKAWIPRVRKVGNDGTVRTLAIVRR
jgi:sugar lactone lactonase YvrE